MISALVTENSLCDFLNKISFNINYISTCPCKNILPLYQGSLLALYCSNQFFLSFLNEPELTCQIPVGRSGRGLMYGPYIGSYEF